MLFAPAAARQLAAELAAVIEQGKRLIFALFHRKTFVAHGFFKVVDAAAKIFFGIHYYHRYYFFPEAVRYVMKLQEELIDFFKNNGVADVGFCRVPDGPFGEKSCAVSIAVKLSDAVTDEITDKPTHTYFHHYRTVNAFIDRTLLQAGFLLEKYGFRYIPVAASQSINADGWNYEGRYSHKKAACLAGLGGIGKNGLFLHKKFGARVRLGTLFTDCPFETEEHEYFSPCIECGACVAACPSGAILGKSWRPGMERSEIFDPKKCSEYMKKEFKNIGRGAVCGICMRVCPYGGGKNGSKKD